MVVRPLHWVFKIGNRKAAMDFFRQTLKMSVLRHEEFTEGCKAACNGPYDGHWSKTMIGYGAEDTHFVLELTYNYNINSYRQGNDMRCVEIRSKSVFASASAHDGAVKAGANSVVVHSPDGYRFIVVDEDVADTARVTRVCLNVTSLSTAKEFWVGRLGMTEKKSTSCCGKDDSACCPSGGVCCCLQFDHPALKDFCLVLCELAAAETLDHAAAAGRIAFARPGEELQPLQKTFETDEQTKAKHILTPYVSLDTPGKATVQVVILGDPDGYEICFVGEEGFTQLSKVDSKANALLDKAIADDASDEWFAKLERRKVAEK